jgi:hypothetical protein
MATSSSDASAPDTVGNSRLSDADKVQRVVFELVETERAYVQCLSRLIEHYLRPLRDAAHLFPTDVAEQLLLATSNVHKFQKSFCDELLGAAGSSGTMSATDEDSNASERMRVRAPHTWAHIYVSEHARSTRRSILECSIKTENLQSILCGALSCAEDPATRCVYRQDE